MLKAMTLSAVVAAFVLTGCSAAERVVEEAASAAPSAERGAAEELVVDTGVGQQEACATALADQVGTDWRSVRVDSRDTAAGGNAVLFLRWADDQQASCEIDGDFYVVALQPLGKTTFTAVTDVPVNVKQVKKSCIAETAKRLKLHKKNVHVKTYEGSSEGTLVQLHTTDGRRPTCFVTTDGAVRDITL